MNNHFIFDVDGTLTPSRGEINPGFKSFLMEFALRNKVYLVTGSDKPKTVEQIGEDLYNRCHTVYNCSGNDVWQKDKNIFTNTWKLSRIANKWLQEQLDASKFKLRTGLHFEHRTGMVNFSVVGRNADAEQRAAYVAFEEQNGERKKIADAFNTMFPDLEAKVGGETGIDIAPRGANKSQILRDFKKDDTIHFYGDAMFEGGNDKPLADTLMQYQLGFSHQVRDWKHTWEKLK